MNLEEYWNSYLAYVESKPGIGLFPKVNGVPAVLAALVAAGHQIGLPPEQLDNFIRKFREIDDVVRRLTLREIEIDKIAKISEEFKNGCFYSKEVIPKIFKKEEVAKQYHEIMFP
jgi:hypothetical protein